MGISPVHKGWSCCWMGSTANSDSSRVATSSEVCNWLICRLPITRTLRRMAPYIKNVRSRETAIPSPSFFSLVWGRQGDFMSLHKPVPGGQTSKKRKGAALWSG